MESVGEGKVLQRSWFQPHANPDVWKLIGHLLLSTEVNGPELEDFVQDAFWEQLQYFTLPHGFQQTPPESAGMVGTVDSSRIQMEFCSKFILPDSVGSSNTLQVHSTGFQHITTHYNTL